MVELIAGIVLVIALIWVARSTAFEMDRSFYPVLLIVIALYYVLFAFQTFHVGSILFEVFVAILFSGLAIWGNHRSLIIVGFALIFHGIYDLLHGLVPFSTNTPEWWPLFCFGEDVVHGLWLILLTHRKNRN